MSAFFAFLHHLFAFCLFSALVLELVLLRRPLTLDTARLLQRADLAYGVTAGLILVIGLARVFYFEKGTDFYFHSLPFMLKMSLFAVVGVLSVWPTLEFLRWGKALKQDQLPQIEAGKLRQMALVVHIELTGLLLIMLCAALMARGIWML